MNLHSMVAPMIGAVNPFIPITVKRSVGYATSADGLRVPAYVTTTGVPAQVQGVKAKELELLAGNNIQGILRSVHLNGDWEGIQRAQAGGGDVFLFGGAEWLVVWVWETWPDWCRVVVQQQVNTP